MELEILAPTFTVWKAPRAALPEATWLFVGKTDRELSVLCETAAVPADALCREDGYRGLRVCGTLDFELVGVLAGLTGALQRAGIPVFVVSTFDTDYLFCRADRLPEAVAALRVAGYGVRGVL